MRGRDALLTGFFIATLIVAWGGNYALVKLALIDAAPFTFNALRFSGAAIIVGSSLKLLGIPLLPEPGERRPLALIGFCQVTVMLGLSSVGLLWIEASRAVLLAYTMPLWAIVLGALILNEPLDRQRIAGFAIGFCGLAILFNPLAMDWSDGMTLMGSGFALAGTVGWATGSTLYRKRLWRSAFWTQVFWQVAMGALPLILLAATLEPDASFTLTPRLAALIVYNWLVPAAFAYWCWAQVLTRMPASTAGQLLLLAPVFGVILAHLIFRTPLGPSLLIAGLLILTGAWLSLTAPTAPRQSRR